MIIETQVDASSPTINKIVTAILRATQTDLRPDEVHVSQVDRGWTYEVPLVWAGTNNGIFRGKVDGSSMRRYSGGDTITAPAPNGEIVVMALYIGYPQNIWIIVPQLDAATLDVARDAWMIGDKRAAKAILRHLGPYAGIGLAIIESQSNMLGHVASGKTSRQLDREIEDYLQSRKASHSTKASHLTRKRGSRPRSSK